jgi:hypothetical protein
MSMKGSSQWYFTTSEAMTRIISFVSSPMMPSQIRGWKPSVARIRPRTRTDTDGVFDVYGLCDVFESFRNLSLKTYGLDPCYYYGAPGLTWDAMLKHTNVELEALSDQDMLHAQVH